MTRYETSCRTVNAAQGQAPLEVIAGPKGCRLIGIIFTLAGVGATVIGLGRPAAAGIVPFITAQLLNPENGDPALSIISLAANASPSSPNQFTNRCSTTGAAGYVSDQLVPPAGIWIPAGQTFVMFNIISTVGATLDVDVAVLE